MGDQKCPAWHFIPLDQYARPVEPASKAVREGILGLLDHIRMPRSTNGAFLVRTDLTSVPPFLMERVATQPDWTAPTPALDQALGT